MTFQHRAGVSPYTSPCGFARTCVFSKQSLPPGLCDPHPQPARGLRVRAPLLPKLRGHFAEFLNHDSLVRLGILCPTTCVGFGYGRPSTIASRLFSAPQDHPAIPHQCGVTITPHPRHQRQPPGFTWAAGYALERTKPSGPPGYHCASPLLTRLPTITGTPRPTHTTKPEGPAGGEQIG